MGPGVGTDQHLRILNYITLMGRILFQCQGFLIKIHRVSKRQLYSGMAQKVAPPKKGKITPNHLESKV